jgi:molecular chaperone GrpE
LTRRKHKHEGEASRPEVEGEEGLPPTDDELAAGELFTAPPASSSEATAPPSEPSTRPADELDAELQRVKAEAAEYLDGWQRARAEFANYKKRVEREQQDSHARAAAGILVRFLPVLDDLERALKERPAQADPAWLDGIGLVQRKLRALLEAEGVEAIPAEGVSFDPTMHEAVTHEVSGDHQEGQIIEVLQQGYRLGDRVLRPAQVRVAK